MNDTFKCENCGSETSFDALDYELSETASLTCPVCKSKIELSAILTEPGTPPGEIEPAEIEMPSAEEEPGPEAGEEEIVSGEEEVVAPAGGEGPEQITPKESAEDRVSKAFQELDDGKELGEVLGSLLHQPVKLKSPSKLGVIKERKYINLTPSPSEYRHLLKIIMRDCKSKPSREWARDEYEKMKDVKSWKTEEPLPAVPAKDLMHREPEEVESKKVSEAVDQDDLYWGSGASFRNSAGYGIYFADGYIEIYDKTNHIITSFEPEDMVEEGKEVEELTPKDIAEKEDKPPEEWKGDFATFHAKLFGCASDLDIPVEEYEKVILELQDKDALKLNQDKVEIDLKKAKDVLVDYLKGRVGEVAADTQDLTKPPPAAPALGTPPPEEAPLPAEAVTEQEENEDSIEDQVSQCIKKYFG